MTTPRIVNYGSGVDSTAMLVGMHARGERPDLIIFSDTGSEKPETIAYLDVMDAWLRKVGFPIITRVAYKPSRAKYTTLDGLCIAHETLPSLAFGKHSCSLRFKAEVIDRWILGVSRGPNKCAGWTPAVEARAAGIKPVKSIGYDNGKADGRRAGRAMTEDKHFRYRFPLREWGWDRQECIRQIEAAGLPTPIKSACWMCPASKKWELLWLAGKHPELFIRAIAIEDNARDGKHGLDTVKGLGRNWSWREWAETEGILSGNEVVMSSAELLERAAAAKPEYEANDVRPCGQQEMFAS